MRNYWFDRFALLGAVIVLLAMFASVLYAQGTGTDTEPIGMGVPSVQEALGAWLADNDGDGVLPAPFWMALYVSEEPLANVGIEAVLVTMLWCSGEEWLVEAIVTPEGVEVFRLGLLDDAGDSDQPPIWLPVDPSNPDVLAPHDPTTLEPIPPPPPTVERCGLNPGELDGEKGNECTGNWLLTGKGTIK